MKDKQQSISEAIVILFQSDPKGIYNYKQVCKRKGFTSQKKRRQVRETIETLAEEGLLIEVERGKYRYNSISAVATGVFQRRSNGNNAFLPDDGSASISA